MEFKLLSPNASLPSPAIRLGQESPCLVFLLNVKQILNLSLVMRNPVMDTDRTFSFAAVIHFVLPVPLVSVHSHCCKQFM